MGDQQRQEGGASFVEFTRGVSCSTKGDGTNGQKGAIEESKHTKSAMEGDQQLGEGTTMRRQEEAEGRVPRQEEAEDYLEAEEGAESQEDDDWLFAPTPPMPGQVEQ